MRHHNRNRKLGRERKGRRALLKTLAGALITREKILTTEAKAKELRPFVERLVTHARKNTLATRRLLVSRLGNPLAVKRLSEVIGPKYVSRPGGYTRIIKMPPRKSDGSPMAQISFV